MIVYRTKTELILHLEHLRAEGKSIGVVPTMGALHDGHISLVKKSTGENNVTVVTIFVNPTQFNDPSDLESYPRTPEKDLELMRSHKVDVVFVPSVREMYPETDTRTFDLGGLDVVMEGAHREGHFNGVAQIVTKLFEAVRPHRAYFGQKDFQQLVIIRHLAKQLEMELEIVACPIIREKDGLAMSSRNALLSRPDRQTAPFIYRTLLKASKMKEKLSPAYLEAWVRGEFEKQSNMKLEYFEVVDDKMLKKIQEWSEDGDKVGCIAVLLGGVRLIDNVIFD
ncbi:MAG: pantoate--beta-alanine ligase [Bacteroidota bacterium]